MPVPTRAVIGAYLTLSVLYLAGVLLFYGPIAAEDAPGPPPVPRLVAFLVSITLYIVLFVWLSREIGNSLKAAMAVAFSQLLLVDVDYLLSGDRGVATAAASAVLLLVSWGVTGWVYGKLDSPAVKSIS